MKPMKERLAGLIDALSQGLIERQTQVRLALLAALAGEHLLLIGPPGTAKSELARRLHRAFRDAAYFERLLTRFSVPEELFGPLSIAALEQDRYERQTAGYLPSASIAFIDEVFKANSAILNALLSLLNEREFDNGAQRVPTPLISVIGATNTVPEDEVTAAFYDRFLLRCAVEPLSPESFASLLALPTAYDIEVADELRLSNDDLARVAQRLDAVGLPENVLELLHSLRELLAAEQIYVSDRRWRKIVRLLKTSALTDGRNSVSVWDVWLTQFCAVQRVEQRERIAQWYGAALGTYQAVSPERFTRVVEAFEAQLELEENAEDLNYDSQGQLALAAGIADPKRGESALRMPSFLRRRAYGRRHIEARVAQCEELVEQMDGYLARLNATLHELSTTVAEHLWISPGFAPSAAESLEGTRSLVEALRQRVQRTLAGFAALPRTDVDHGGAPDPILVG
jgi:MoxR-like ATPase